MLGEKSESEILERVTGVGPVSSPWKGDIIPLYHTRGLARRCRHYRQFARFYGIHCIISA